MICNSTEKVDIRFRRTLSAGVASANRTAKGSIGRVSAIFAEIKDPNPARNAALVLTKAVLRDGFRSNQE